MKTVLNTTGLSTIVKAAGHRITGTGQGNLGWSCYTCPMQLKLPDGSYWRLPADPLIAVTCKNVLIRRYVSKSSLRGSIKERWSTDDCEINITGQLMADNAEELADQIRTLRYALEVKEAVEVVCDILNEHYDVTRIAVESISFPATAGECNQSFTIKSYSDEGYALLEEA